MTPGAKIAANQRASLKRCSSVRSSRRSMRFTASLLTPKLAIEVTTPILISNVRRCCSTGAHYNGVNPNPSFMEAPATFHLIEAAQANFPTEYGQFRIYGFEGRTGKRVEEAVVL